MAGVGAFFAGDLAGVGAFFAGDLDGVAAAFFSGVAAFLETGDLAATTPLLRSPRGDRGGAAGEKAFAAAAAAATSW